MNYRSVADLNHDIVKSLYRIPADIDVVVGIPRSGLLAATLVALALNLPLADIDGFAQGRLLSSGVTRRRKALDQGFEVLKHALVLDDSIHTGGSMAQARSKLAHLSPSISLTYLAIYGVDTASIANADIVFEIVPQPRVFQWNVMHHDILASACVDIDGVLCIDPTPEENDDGLEYLNFLSNARPLCLPTI
jgi:hypoxanthine phosphoribosyltransferase